MKHIISGIVYAISYFTVLPVSQGKFDANKQFYKGILIALPFIGLLFGAIISAMHIGLSYIVPTWYASVFVSILYPFLYGFLHLEAVADTIDGWYASLSKKDVYEVMHEPQVGSIGAIGSFCFVLLKILALTYLLSNAHYLAIIIIFALSRLSILFSLSFDFHAQSYFALALKNSIKVSVIFKVLFLPIALLNKLILKKLQKQLGFLNGDTLGFSIELIEIILLNIVIIIVA
jgi:adenosylcobinamide-GDP ribazoletransferase